MVQPDQHAVIDNVVQDVSHQSDVARVAEPIYIPSKTGTGDVVLVNVYPGSAPQDASTTDLVNHLRDDTIPQAVGDSGVKILVGGTTAIYIDFANVLSSKLPALHRPGGAAVLPPADDGVPQLRHSAHGRRA